VGTALAVTGQTTWRRTDSAVAVVAVAAQQGDIPAEDAPGGPAEERAGAERDEPEPQQGQKVQKPDKE
jgi:hypothetical protein